MSHVVRNEIKTNDLDSLAIACAAIGLEFRSNQKQHRYYMGQMSACEHAIALPGANEYTYEVGVVKDAEGNFYLAHDTWRDQRGQNDKLNEILGNGQRNLIAAYLEQVARSKHPTAHIAGKWNEKNTKYVVEITLGGDAVGASGNGANFGYSEQRSW